jgi:hypothetical protein
MTPKEKWGTSLQLLVRLTQEGPHPMLPQFWLDLVAAPKRFECTMISQATNATTADLGLVPDLALIIIPVLAVKIMSFNFSHSNSNEFLEYGIHPFMVGY